MPEMTKPKTITWEELMEMDFGNVIEFPRRFNCFDCGWTGNDAVWVGTEDDGRWKCPECHNFYPNDSEVGYLWETRTGDEPVSHRDR